MKYEMHTTGEFETTTGVAWIADLIRDGQVIGTVENEGNGGCDIVRITDIAEFKLWNEYVKDRFDGNVDTATLQLYIDVVNKVHYGI